MKGIEQQYLRLCIKSLCKARSELLQLTCEEAISKSPYGKGDCLYLDAAPEIEICSLFRDFDPHLPLVTEEIGSNVQLKATEEQVICFSDPIFNDESSPNSIKKHFYSGVSCDDISKRYLRNKI